MLTFAMKLKGAYYKSHWNILVFCNQIWICLMKKWLICFISIIWVHFIHKIEKIWIWKSMNY